MSSQLALMPPILDVKGVDCLRVSSAADILGCLFRAEKARSYFLKWRCCRTGGWHSGSALASQASDSGVPLHEVVGSNPTSSTFFPHLTLLLITRIPSYSTARPHSPRTPRLLWVCTELWPLLGIL